MISAKELMLLEDTLKHEKLLVKKYLFYASRAQDEVIKKKYQEISKKHKKHFDMLIKFLG